MKNKISRAQKIGNLLKAGVVLSVALNSELLAASGAESKCVMGKAPIKNEQTKTPTKNQQTPQQDSQKPATPKISNLPQTLEGIKIRLLRELLNKRILLEKIDLCGHITMGEAYNADRDENVLKERYADARMNFYALLDELILRQKDETGKNALKEILKISIDIDCYEDEGLRELSLRLQNEQLKLIENLGK
ncbi:MAG: hypothetical protein J6T16_04840 [Opitutales bacterium]|nr:hypothetical protein [Opitutales bacterium]